MNTDIKTVDIQTENQVELGSAEKNNSPNYRIAAHQTKQIMSQFLIMWMLEKIMLILVVLDNHETASLSIIRQMTMLINIEFLNYFIKNMLGKKNLINS